MGIESPGLAMPCAAASIGDLVCGLANVLPPATFVGQVGSPADQAAQGMVGGVLREAGVPAPGTPKVTINGRKIGTTAEMVTALPASPTPGIARMYLGSGIARVAGQALTLQWGQAHVTPLSVMANMGGTQSFVRLDGLSLSEPPAGLGVVMSNGPSMLDEIRRSIPTRTDFGEPSSLAEILASCSAGRQLDLAPAEYEVLVGDPVNVVTGAVITQTVDYEQVSPPLRLRRRYDSRRSDRRSSLGWGWSHDLEQSIRLEPRRVVLRDGDGREREFSTNHLPGRVTRPGDTLQDSSGRYRLRCIARLQWELSDGRSVRHFAEVEGEPAEEREQGTARLVRVAHPDAPLIELEYAAGRLVEVYVGGRRALRFEYGAAGLLRRFFAAAGEGEIMQAELEHSADGDLLRVKDAYGHAREYEYLDHLLVRETNRDGGSFWYGYDGAGPRARCVRSWGDGGYLTRTLEHDPAAGTTTVHDSYGQPTVYRYDAAGCVTGIDGPRERRSMKYDDKLRLIEIRWGDGTRESASYDRDGNLVERVDRDGSRWSMEYGPDGRMIAGTDPQGGRWSYAHDERGRLRRVEDPTGHATRFDFDERGGLCRITEPTGNQMFLRIDDEGRITEMPQPGKKGRVAYKYDERGLLRAARDSEDRRSSWVHDANGKLVRRDGLRTRTAWERSPEGFILAEQQGTRLARVQRDAFGLVRGIDFPERSVAYALDTEGRLLKASGSDASEPLLAIERSEQGLVEAYEMPSLGRCELEHDLRSSRITGMSLPEGHLRIEQDDAGRLTSLTRPDGSTWRYEYRKDGLLTAASNERVSCSWTRDPRGAIVAQRWGSVEIGDLNPDHLGRRVGLRIGKDVRVSYLRSSAGEVEDVAIVAGSEVEAGTELQGRSGASVPAPAGPEAGADDLAAVDPLWRPISAKAAEAVVWDEDRCVLQEGRARIHHPDEGRLMFVVDGEGKVDAVPEAEGQPAPSEPAPLDRAYEAAFPHLACQEEVAEDALPTPTQLLRQLLGYRVWSPRPRPLPGQAPWNPESWQSRVESPEPDEGRLESTRVLHAMGAPHPRPPLLI
ncbi:MAG: RHS repeat protein [Myxococcales bacterium]|nr:RHS repeat protein [Myxococcales bacterium]